MKYSIVITTGGTGGHVYPALAVAEKLRDQAEILFIGSQHGPEVHMVQREDIPFYGLSVKGVLGKGWKSFFSLCKMGQGILEAQKILQEFKPNVVVGFGSYASFAPLIAAKLKGIPIIIHEQNAFPGLANRFLARFANKILLSMPDKGSFFPKNKSVYTGNPVRERVISLRKNIDSQKKVSTKNLLVMGGSLGARTVNTVIINGLKELFENGIEIQHQTGFKDWDRTAASYALHEKRSYQVMPFIEDIAKAYSWADLVVCRAGASSIAELIAIGKPSILIPFPHATHNHQAHNAQFLVNEGAALVIHEKDIWTTDVVKVIIDLFKDRNRIEEISRAAYNCGDNSAATLVAKEIIDLLSTKEYNEV